MKNNCRGIFVFVFAAFSVLVLCGCFKKRKTDFESLPAPVATELSTIADKFFPSNSEQRKNWLEVQAKCWKELNSSAPSVPLLDYSVITEEAKKRFPSDYQARLNFVKEQVDGYNKLKELSSSANPAQWQTAKAVAEKFSPNDFVGQSYTIVDWLEFFKNVNNMSLKFPAGTFQPILKKAIDSSKGSVTFANEYMQTQYYAAIYLSGLTPYAMSRESFDAALKDAAAKFPDDLAARKKFLDGEFVRIRREANAAEYSAQRQRLERQKNLAEENSVDENALEKLFSASVFTRRGENENVYTAVYAAFKGKPVIFCSKEFIRSGLPQTLKNSSVKIICSTAYIADNLPIVMLVPDRTPDIEPVLSVVSAEQSAKLPGKRLLMFSPDNGGIKLGFMKVFSEDEKYYNPSFDSAPVILRTKKVGPVNRYSENLMIEVSESLPSQNNAVLIDFENRTFVSYGLQQANPGVLEWSGRTGSVIGHESLAIPDFNTFVANFDNTRLSSSPNNTLRYARLTAIEKWTPFDPAKLEQQKTIIRKFTDENNDYLMYFKNNLYGAALRSQRLFNIARKYKNDFVYRRMDQTAFLSRYKSYMMDVMMSMRHDEKRFTPSEFYSIYRDELEYQIALRKAMYDYIAETIRDNKIVNVIHTDLRTRYQNPMEPYELRDFSGSLGTGF